MGRSPSPTTGRRREDPKRERDRVERSRRDRHRSRDRERSRSRDNNPRSTRTRQRSTERRANRRSRSRSESPTAGGSTKPSQASRSKAQVDRPAVTQADLEGKSPEEQEMIRVMGFGGFQTTKGKKVENNEAGEVQVVLKRKYRQYMNRKGGFNRPLDFVA